MFSLGIKATFTVGLMTAPMSFFLVLRANSPFLSITVQFNHHILLAVIKKKYNIKKIYKIF